MRKNIRLFIAGALFAFALSGCSDSKSKQKVEDTTEVTTEATTEMTTEQTTEATTEADSVEEINSEVVSYSNSAGTYTLNVDNYVEFIETTTHPTSSVNNEDGLEINHGDVYITIQRFPQNDSLYMDVEGFYNYLNGDSFLSMVVAENEINVANDAVVECKNQTVEMKSGNAVFVGYLYYIKTDEGFYKAMISGSDLEVIEHYKNFVDNMTFN